VRNELMTQKLPRSTKAMLINRDYVAFV